MEVFNLGKGIKMKKKIYFFHPQHNTTKTFCISRWIMIYVECNISKYEHWYLDTWYLFLPDWKVPLKGFKCYSRSLGIKFVFHSLFIFIVPSTPEQILFFSKFISCNSGPVHFTIKLHSTIISIVSSDKFWKVPSLTHCW